MAGEFKYLSKPVSRWTEEDLRHAQRHPEMIREELRDAVDARLEALRANRRLLEERSRARSRERKLRSFSNTSSKPSSSIDTRSVKHAVQDATTTKKGGGPALTIAGVAAAYDWISDRPELGDLLVSIPAPVYVVVIAGGVGWWIILFAIRLAEKWSEEH